MKLKAFLFAILATVAIQFPAAALSAARKEVIESAEVFHELVSEEEGRIPSWLVRDAHAIAIVTNIKHGGFLFGGRRGDGLMVTKLQNGNWSNPAFLNLTGGSIGLQAGFKLSDLVLIFPTKSSLDNVLSEDFELGGSVSGTAGPVGKTARESLESFEDTIYAYSHSEGLFGGVALEGSKLAFDKKDNLDFYDQPVTVERILTDPYLDSPLVTRFLHMVLKDAE